MKEMLYLIFSQNCSPNNDNAVIQEEDLVSSKHTDYHEDSDTDLLYTNESLLPQVDWDNLEKQLKQAQVERERYDKVGFVSPPPAISCRTKEGEKQFVCFG